MTAPITSFPIITLNIAGLPVVASPSLTDIIPVVHAGVTSKETLAQIGNLFGMLAVVSVTNGVQQMASNTCYIANTVAGNVVFTLPTTSSLGDTIVIMGRLNGWSVVQNAGQQIFISPTNTTITTGSIASTNPRDSIVLRCTAANLEWESQGGPQSTGLTII